MSHRTIFLIIIGVSINIFASSPVYFLYTIDSDLFVQFSNNDGTFQAPISIDTIDANSRALAVADFDNDELNDCLVLTKSGELICYKYTEGTSFSKNIIDETNIIDSQEATDGDFNNDGFIDFIVSDTKQKKIFLFFNKGKFTFEPDTLDASWLEAVNESDGFAGLDAGDINEDGNLDFLILNYVWSMNNPNKIYAYLGNGDGSFIFTNAFEHFNPGGVLGLALGDFNNDDHLDVVLGQDDDGDPGQTWIYFGDGTGNFSFQGEAFDVNPNDESGEDMPGSGFFDAYDFDSSGTLDIITCAKSMGIFYFEGNGDGTFGNKIELVQSSSENMFAIAAPHIKSNLRSINPAIEQSYNDIFVCEYGKPRILLFAIPEIDEQSICTFEYGFFNFDYIVDEHPIGITKEYVDFNLSINSDEVDAHYGVIDSVTKRCRIDISAEIGNNATSDVLEMKLENLGGGDAIAIVKPQLVIKSFPNITGSEKVDVIFPIKSFQVQNYPNPFNSTTQIVYHLEKPSNVEITIYNSLGQKVRTVLNQFMEAGIYKTDWDCLDESNTHVSTGTYFIHVAADGEKLYHRILYLK